jgi:hypothetical protein
MGIMTLSLCLTILISFTRAQGQCNTTLNKLLPETSINNDDRFGSAVAANGQYMVVAAENSDTLGILYAGAAHVYEKTVAGWAYRAMLVPSDPDEYDFFGNEVAIDASGNTIVIINRNYKKGGLYIFEKPPSGWETSQETFNIKFPEYLEFNSSLDISDDGSTIVVSNPMSSAGLLYLLEKPVNGWASTMTPETLVARSNNSGIWLGSDVLIQDDYIYASTNNNSEENPGIFVYKKNGGLYSLIAKLSASIFTSSLGHFGYSLAVHGNQIAATGLVYESNTLTQRFFIFEKQGEWSNMNETAQFQLPSMPSYKFPFPIQFISPTEMVAGVLLKEDSYYTGKLVQITTSNGTWHDVSTSVLFEDKELSVPSEFANELVWNGSELIMATARKSIGYAFRNSIYSLTRSAGLWGSEQKITLPRNSSSNVNLGTSIVKTKDAMFAGAPYDGTMGRGAGAVYVYNQMGEDFVKVNTILPSQRKIRPTGGSDAGFGYSMSVFEDELAVGAPSFLYTTDSYSYGKIFLYRRNTPDWTSVTLYDSLTVPQDLDLNHVGTALAMNDHVLFASAYNNFGNEHTNSIVIFEKSNGKWMYRQQLNLGKPIDKSWPSINLSLNGDQLAVGEFFTIGGGISIVNKNQSNGNWEVTAFISGDIYSGLGGAVKLLDDHLFAGAPGFDYANIYRSGAVAVFTKLPGEPWRSDMEPSAVIGPSNPIEGAFFGSSIDAIGNTLVVGAPGMFLTFDSQVRTVPGNSYVIQSKDYYWKNTTQYLALQGDRYASNERDHFGSRVVLDEKYVYVGARSENTETGKFSGAVYYIPAPPVIFLHYPVCFNAEPFIPDAYPFGGTWSGPGIDEDGQFNPQLAGVGKAILTYTTPNCSHPGTVEIEVAGEGSIHAISPLNVMKCSEEEIQLKVDPADGAQFSWYYMPVNATSFVLLGTGGPTYEISNPGDYKAVGTKECVAESPVFHIQVENFPISTGPQPVVCSGESVSLVASSSEGIWEGFGVSNNTFNPAGMQNGYHYLTFHIVTPTGCNLVLVDSIKLNLVPPLSIHSNDSDFCETGEIALVADPADPALTYSWFYGETTTTPFALIDQELDYAARMFRQGYYSVSAANEDCQNKSDTITVGLNAHLPFIFSAEKTSVILCNEEEYSLTVAAREGTFFTWQYKAPGATSFEIVNESYNDVFVASKDGDYRVGGEFGFCNFETLPASVTFLDDDIYVPNVFTPNGDDSNPVFRVETPFEISQLLIVNRDGRKIHSSITGEWDGGNAPCGVYFWHLQYKGCYDDYKELKGWVHLIR